MIRDNLFTFLLGLVVLAGILAMGAVAYIALRYAPWVIVILVVGMLAMAFGAAVRIALEDV